MKDFDEISSELLEVLLKKVIELYECDREGAYMYLIGSANKEGKVMESNYINKLRLKEFYS